MKREGESERVSLAPPRGLETWNSPEAIPEHRAMTPEQRLRKAIALSQADLDLVVERSWENAGALEQALRELGARDLDGREETIVREALVRRADRRLLTRYGELHLMREVDGVPDYGELQPAAAFEIGGVRFQAASLAALRSMKRAADRAKDRIDLAELDALDGPDESAPPV